MPPATSNERPALFRYLTGQREHVFKALEGLDGNDLGRPILPSHWTCLGLVSHLSLDVERFCEDKRGPHDPGPCPHGHGAEQRRDVHELRVYVDGCECSGYAGMAGEPQHQQYASGKSEQDGQDTTHGAGSRGSFRV